MSIPTTIAPIADLLGQVGISSDAISAASPESRVRQDLALSSIATTDLQLLMQREHGVTVNLWDQTDYTLAELSSLIDEQGHGR